MLWISERSNLITKIIESRTDIIRTKTPKNSGGNAKIKSSEIPQDIVNFERTEVWKDADIIKNTKNITNILAMKRTDNTTIPRLFSTSKDVIWQKYSDNLREASSYVFTFVYHSRVLLQTNKR